MFSFRTAVVGTVLTTALTGGAAVATAGPRWAAAATVDVVAAPLQEGSKGPQVTALQQRLNALGYWIGTPTGYYGTNTAQAVMALQKVAGLERDGVFGPRTKAALDKGVRPTPRSRKGHVVEVDKAHQVLVVADDGRATRIFNVSTGGEYYYTVNGHRYLAHTPEGSWKVFRAVPGWDHGPLGDMYRPQYVVGGIAVHGVGSPKGVGAYPASHGCVRTTVQTQDELLGSGALRVGTRVDIY